MVLGWDCVRGRCVRGWWYSCLPSWGDAREEAPDGVSPVEGACTRRPVAPGGSPSAGTFHGCGASAVVGGPGGGCGDGGGGRGHPALPGTFHSGRGHPARTGTGLLSPTASNAPGWNETRPAVWNVPGGRAVRGRKMPPWRRPGAAGYSGQGEPHLVPGHAAVVGGGQALVDETQARVEAHEVVEAGEHQALAAVDTRRLNDGAQQSGG